MKRLEPIRIGDKFQHDGTLWEVVAKRPGGHMEVFSKERSSFVSCYQKTFRQWGWEREPQAKETRS